MPKNIVVCLDGTNNKVRAAANTNVVRLFSLLDLGDATKQVGYYDPGVGTFSSAAAWTPPARTLSRYAGLMFGAGLRENLGEAYRYLMAVYEPGDRLFIFGFSRGAYTARALTGMLEVFGIFRPEATNLVPYAVSEYAKEGKRKTPSDWKLLREYAQLFGADLGLRRHDHAPVHFMGMWDTVKAAGHVWRQLRWPYTRQLPHVGIVRHAVSIDEARRPYSEYLVDHVDPDHLIPARQDLLQVWFAGVHTDVGGWLGTGARLSDIPLKWMTEHAVKAGLIVRPHAYHEVSKVEASEATTAVRRMSPFWYLLGHHHRVIPEGAYIHASVQRRLEADPGYVRHLPKHYSFVDPDWEQPHPLSRPAGRRRRSAESG